MCKLVDLMFRADNCMEYAINLGNAIKSEKELTVKLFKNKNSYYWLLTLCKDDNEKSKYDIKIINIITNGDLIFMKCKLTDTTLNLLPKNHIMNMNAIYDDANGEIIGFILKGTNDNFYTNSIETDNYILSYVKIKMDNFINKDFSSNFNNYVSEYITDKLIDKLKYVINSKNTSIPKYIVFITGIILSKNILNKNNEIKNVINNVLDKLYSNFDDDILYIRTDYIYASYMEKYIKIPTSDAASLYIKLDANRSDFIRSLFHKYIDDYIDENLNNYNNLTFEN